ncbi:hypothetical protein VX159_11440 [Dechloromonas sp. ZY10]|uniref:hypothetical protein n=1 Tax=Dechloromonas aquae TaxID=2664436 RepID=UPI003528C2E1
MRKFWLGYVLVYAAGCGLASASDAREVTVAGLQPDRRPVAAPRIVSFEQSEAWKANAVRGLGLPANGTAFLKDQGAWYTPFNRPNMPGYYDLRGLHVAGKASGKN